MSALDRDFARRYGPWAVVTGATSGIGEEVARQLAAEGLNLVLVARRDVILENLADDLRTRHRVQVETVVADLATDEGFERMRERTRGLQVGLLVPSAGVEHHGDFFGRSAAETGHLLDLNVRSPLMLARHFGERMRARGRGGILFVSSLVAQAGVPYFAAYAASKAYVQSLGEALHEELAPYGVDVTVLAPGLTDTSMLGRIEAEGTDLSRALLPLMPAGPVVEAGLRGLGRRSVVVPGRANRFLAWLARYGLTRTGAARVFGRLMRRALPPAALHRPVSLAVRREVFGEPRRLAA